MIPTSDRFKREIRDSHTIGTRCEIYDEGRFIRTLDINDGNVWVDYGVENRRRCHVNLTDAKGDLIPAEAKDLLAPFGNELRLYRGITFRDGTQELLPLGVFGINAIQVFDSGDGLLITVDAYDRSKKVSNAKLLDYYKIPMGTNYAVAIRDLIQSRMPNAVFSFAATNHVTPTIVLKIGDDPWVKALEMAKSVGMDLFFDVLGNVCLFPVKDPLTAPVDWVYQEGAECTLSNVTKRWSVEGTVNHWVVTGENTDAAAPVWAEAKDDNPNSPTYYLGDFGDRPAFVTSEYVVSVAQAEAMAIANLRQTLGYIEWLSLTSVVNPAHDALDVVQVVRSNSRVNSRYTVDKITIPLIEERGMDMQVRRRVG